MNTQIDITSKFPLFSLLHSVTAPAVSAAKRKKPLPLPYQRLLVTPDGHAVSTDGHRLHRVNLTALEAAPGLYDIKVRTKARLFLTLVDDCSVDDYPDYKRIIPAAGTRAPKTFGSQTVEGRTAEIIKALLENLSVDLSYAADALSLLSYEPEAEFSVDGGGPVVISLPGDARLALIMPLQRFKL